MVEGKHTASWGWKCELIWNRPFCFSRRRRYRLGNWSVSGVRPTLSLLCRLAVLQGSWAKSPTGERTGALAVKARNPDQQAARELLGVSSACLHFNLSRGGVERKEEL